jgi:hypothetical protein
VVGSVSNAREEFKVAKKAKSSGGAAVAEPEEEKQPVLFSVGCMFGRAGFGAESGSVSVKFPDGVLSASNQSVFIQNNLLVTISTNPTPPGAAQQSLPGMDDAHEQRTLQVSAKRISVGENDVSVTLKFEKKAVSADFLSTIAARAGSLIVHEILSGDAE